VERNEVSTGRGVFQRAGKDIEESQTGFDGAEIGCNPVFSTRTEGEGHLTYGVNDDLCQMGKE